MKKWFIYMQGEVLGPLTAETVLSMLQQNRLQFVDFVWASGLTKWHRANELDEFAKALPKYPSLPIPQATTTETAATIPTPAPTPAPAAVVAPVSTPVSAPVAPPPASQEPATAPPPVERRKFPKERLFERVPVGEASVEVIGHGNFQVLNISEGGVLLHTDKPIAIGTEVQFKLFIKSENKTLEMSGIVLRHGHDVDGKLGFAIQYKRLNPAHKRYINDYVKQKT